MTAIEDAFRWARIHSVRHMDACEQAGLRWGETSITEIVTSRAAKAVTVVPFTQRAEALSGADWVWWWVDRHGAYGMLVQAKRLTIRPRRWAFDFGYPNGSGTQRATLMSTASRLGLLPAFALYLGTADYRSWQLCPDGHVSGRCLQCVKRSVSLMPALLADASLVSDSISTYQWSVALEDLWKPAVARAQLIPALKRRLDPDLLDFLSTRHKGALGVSRSMIDLVLRARFGQFSAVTEAGADVRSVGDHDALGRLFNDFPDDRGHWGVNYFSHLLDPLRQAPPGYVLEIMSGDFTEDGLASDMPDNIAGIVVVRLPGQAG